MKKLDSISQGIPALSMSVSYYTNDSRYLNNSTLPYISIFFYFTNFQVKIERKICLQIVKLIHPTILTLKTGGWSCTNHLKMEKSFNPVTVFARKLFLYHE